MENMKHLLQTPIRLLPEHLPRTIIYGSFLAAFLLIIFFNNRFSDITYPVFWRHELLDKATFFFDPLLCHLLGIILAGILANLYLKNVHSTEPRYVRLLMAYGLPILLLLLIYLLGNYVLKPSFAYSRPGAIAEPLHDPWITSLVENLLPVDLGEDIQDVPSGFATRQVVLFYLVIWLSSQHKKDNSPLLTHKQEIIVLSINFFLVFFVLFSRIYRANHSFFAIVVAIGLATLLFWIFLSIVYSLKYGKRARFILAETFGAFVPMAFVFLTYSEAPDKWAYFSLVILVITSIVYVLAGLNSLKGENH